MSKEYQSPLKRWAFQSKLRRLRREYFGRGRNRKEKREWELFMRRVRRREMRLKNRNAD